MKTHNNIPSSMRPIITVGAVVVVVLALGLGTRFAGAADVKAAESTGVDPAAFAKDKYTSTISPAIIKKAQDVVLVATAIKADAAGAAKQYGVQDGGNAPVYSVEVKGVAGAADANGLMPVVVKGLPAEITVLIQMGPAINGTAVRDATGTVTYQQFVNQLEYQAAATELNNQVKATVLATVDATSLNGKSVDITGAFQYANPAAYIVTPVKIEQAK